MKLQIGVKTRLIKVGGILSQSEWIKRQNDETKIDEVTGWWNVSCLTGSWWKGICQIFVWWIYCY